MAICRCRGLLYQKKRDIYILVVSRCEDIIGERCVPNNKLGDDEVEIPSCQDSEQNRFILDVTG